MKKILIIGAVVIMFGFGNVQNLFAFGDNFESITPEEAVTEMKKDGVMVLDVRTGEEFNGPLGHLEGATLIPVQVLEHKIADLQEHKDKKILVICRGGVRSRTASKMLTDNGFTAVNILGGMEAMQRAEGAPIVR